MIGGGCCIDTVCEVLSGCGLNATEVVSSALFRSVLLLSVFYHGTVLSFPLRVNMLPSFAAFAVGSFDCGDGSAGGGGVSTFGESSMMAPDASTMSDGGIGGLMAMVTGPPSALLHRQSHTDIGMAMAGPSSTAEDVTSVDFAIPAGSVRLEDFKRAAASSSALLDASSMRLTPPTDAGGATSPHEQEEARSLRPGLDAAVVPAPAPAGGEGGPTTFSHLPLPPTVRWNDVGAKHRGTSSTPPAKSIAGAESGSPMGGGGGGSRPSSQCSQRRGSQQLGSSRPSSRRRSGAGLSRFAGSRFAQGLNLSDDGSDEEAAAVEPVSASTMLAHAGQSGAYVAEVIVGDEVLLQFGVGEDASASENAPGGLLVGGGHSLAAAAETTVSHAADLLLLTQLAARAAPATRVTPQHATKDRLSPTSRKQRSADLPTPSSHGAAPPPSSLTRRRGTVASAATVTFQQSTMLSGAEQSTLPFLDSMLMTDKSRGGMSSQWGGASHFEENPGGVPLARTTSVIKVLPGDGGGSGFKQRGVVGKSVAEWGDATHRSSSPGGDDDDHVGASTSAAMDAQRYRCRVLQCIRQLATPQSSAPSMAVSTNDAKTPGTVGGHGTLPASPVVSTGVAAALASKKFHGDGAASPKHTRVVGASAGSLSDAMTTLFPGEGESALLALRLLRSLSDGKPLIEWAAAGLRRNFSARPGVDLTDSRTPLPSQPIGGSRRGSGGRSLTPVSSLEVGPSTSTPPPPFGTTANSRRAASVGAGSLSWPDPNGLTPWSNGKGHHTAISNLTERSAVTVCSVAAQPSDSADEVIHKALTQFLHRRARATVAAALHPDSPYASQIVMSTPTMAPPATAAAASHSTPSAVSSAWPSPIVLPGPMPPTTTTPGALLSPATRLGPLTPAASADSRRSSAGSGASVFTPKSAVVWSASTAAPPVEPADVPNMMVLPAIPVAASYALPLPPSASPNTAIEIPVSAVMVDNAVGSRGTPGNLAPIPATQGKSPASRAASSSSRTRGGAASAPTAPVTPAASLLDAPGLVHLFSDLELHLCDATGASVAIIARYKAAGDGTAAIAALATSGRSLEGNSASLRGTRGVPADVSLLQSANHPKSPAAAFPAAPVTTPAADGSYLLVEGPASLHHLQHPPKIEVSPASTYSVTLPKHDNVPLKSPTRRNTILGRSGRRAPPTSGRLPALANLMADAMHNAAHRLPSTLQQRPALVSTSSVLAKLVKLYKIAPPFTLRLTLPRRVAELRLCIALSMRTRQLIEALEGESRRCVANYLGLMRQDTMTRIAWYHEQAAQRHRIHLAMTATITDTRLRTVQREESEHRRRLWLDYVDVTQRLADASHITVSVWTFQGRARLHLEQCERRAWHETTAIADAERKVVQLTAGQAVGRSVDAAHAVTPAATLRLSFERELATAYRTKLSMLDTACMDVVRNDLAAEKDITSIRQKASGIRRPRLAF